MIRFIKSLYVHSRLFYSIGLISLCFMLSFWFPVLYTLSWLLVTFLIALIFTDLMLLFSVKEGVQARRILPEKFSNGDHNTVPVTIQNLYRFNVTVEVIDELPVQFQKRDFLFSTAIRAGQNKDFEYTVRPVERGEYYFGNLNFYCSTPISVLKRRYSFQKNQMVKVYPSFIQMQKYDFLAFSNTLSGVGLKKIRRIGHTMEFEQIKEYVAGDDYRTVNWKATAKKALLMVNQFQDERSQPIYSLIDTGRVMKIPFNDLKLLDYAINTTLAFSNVALKKHDKAGVLMFSKTLEHYLPASGKLTHLNTIMESLYNMDTKFTDSSFEALYAYVKRKITHRGLLFLYTNFEHLSALRRQLPYLKSIARKHLLVVVFFENTELRSFINQEAEDLQSVYYKTIAEKFAYEKRLMLKELQSHGIDGILTAPEELTVNAINKYLQIKARGIL